MIKKEHKTNKNLNRNKETIKLQMPKSMLQVFIRNKKLLKCFKLGIFNEKA